MKKVGSLKLRNLLPRLDQGLKRRDFLEIVKLMAHAFGYEFLVFGRGTRFQFLFLPSKAIKIPSTLRKRGENGDV